MLATSVLTACAAASDAPAADTSAPAVPPSTSSEFAGTELSTVSVPAVDSWSVREDRNEMDDRPQIFVSTPATDAVGFEYPSQHNSQLVVRCMQGETAVAVFGIEPARNPYGEYESVAVRYRLDDRSPTRSVWTEAVGYDGIFAPRPIQFARALAEHDTIRVAYPTIHGREAVITFALAGLAKHLPRVAATCKWKA